MIAGRRVGECAIALQHHVKPTQTDKLCFPTGNTIDSTDNTPKHTPDHHTDTHTHTYNCSQRHKDSICPGASISLSLSHRTTVSALSGIRDTGGIHQQTASIIVQRLSLAQKMILQTRKTGSTNMPLLYTTVNKRLRNQWQGFTN